MRCHVVPFAAVLLFAAGRASAQCAPATRALIADLRFDDARARTEALVRQNGADDAALHCMGVIYMSMDKPGDAATWFERAIAAKDDVSAHHLWLANSLGVQAEHTSRFKLPFLARRIKSEFDRAAQLDPTSIDARHGLIMFYSRAPGVMGGSMDKAREQAAAITTLDPMRGHYEMASLDLHDGDKAAAERELQSAVAAAPRDSAVASYWLASFYVSEKRWADAFATCDRILRQWPADPTAHFQYGRVAALSGENLERGERELKYYLANEPKDAPLTTRAGAHWRLGVIYDRQSKPDSARAELRTAVQLNPRNVDAKKALDALK